MCVLTHFTENLATEVESWKNMQKLRDMAIPLGQKKTLRSQYQKCPKIKVSRALSCKFACSRFLHHISTLGSNVCKCVNGLCRPLLVVDRHRGGEMFTVLLLHKIMIFICIVLSLAILSFLMLPYLVFICNLSLENCVINNAAKYRFNNSTNTAIYADDHIYKSNSVESDAGGDNKTSLLTMILSTAANGKPQQKPPGEIQAAGLKMAGDPNQVDLLQPLTDIIPFFYGFYKSAAGPAKIHDGENAPPLLQLIYALHLPTAYICVVAACLLGVVLYLFHQVIVLIKSVVQDQTVDTWFKTVYASWNYNVVCKTSSVLKHRSIYRHAKQKIQQSKSLARPKTCCTRCLIIAARCMAFVITLGILTAVVLAIHFATLLVFQDFDELTSGDATSFLRRVLANGDPSWKPRLRALVYFLPTTVVTLTKLLMPPISRFLDRFECYPFMVQKTVYSTRLFLGRTAAIFTLVTTIFHAKISHLLGDGDTSLPCWENYLCSQFLILAAMDLAADFSLIVVIRFPLVLLNSMFKREWSCNTKLNFDPYETVVDLVCDLSLVTVGLFYCPVIPLVMCVKLLFGYLLKLFHIWINCSASRDIHSPSCIRFLFIGFAAVIALFAAILLLFSLTFNPVSQSCGPFAFNNLHFPVDALVQELGYFMPPAIWDAKNTTSSLDQPNAVGSGGLSKTTITTYILVALVFVLLFGLYISHLKRLSIERNANELKCQLAVTTQEKCYLISKIKRPRSASQSCSSRRRS